MDLKQIEIMLKAAIDKKDQNRDAELRSKLMSTIGADIVASLTPLLSKMANNNANLLQDLKRAISDIQVNAPDVYVPEIKVPSIFVPDFPKIPVPIVNYTPPAIKIPDIKMPEEMSIRGWINLMGFDKGLLLNPLPVQLRDASGNPLRLMEVMTQILQNGGRGGGGSMGSGKTDYFTIKDLLDGTGKAYNSSNPFPVTITSGSTATTAVNIVDSSGAAYTGSNPVPVTMISGSFTSSVATGPTTSGVADDGSAPVQQGGLVRTTNPTKNTDGQVVKASFDAVGRQLVRPVQARGLIQTAYVTLTGGTETTLRAGVAGAYLDLISIVGSNNSDAAVTVDIRPVTGGNIIASFQLPASGVGGVSFPVPWPQSDTGNNWTADLPDISGTTVYLSALFSQEV